MSHICNDPDRSIYQSWIFPHLLWVVISGLFTREHHWMTNKRRTMKEREKNKGEKQFGNRKVRVVQAWFDEVAAGNKFVLHNSLTHIFSKIHQNGFCVVAMEKDSKATSMCSQSTVSLSHSLGKEATPSSDAISSAINLACNCAM